MSEYVVESGFEVPPKMASGGQSRYPWSQMQHGDSIAVPANEGRNAASSAHAWVARNAPGWHAVRRTLQDGTVRIWLLDSSQED